MTARSSRLRSPESKKCSLTLVEREAISRSIVAGDTIRSKASALGRAPSTVSREIRRNGGRGGYPAAAVTKRAGVQTRFPKPCLLDRNPALLALGNKFVGVLQGCLPIHTEYDEHAARVHRTT